LAKVAVLKNVIGALGLACYCWGTTIIIGIESHFILLERFRFVFESSC
jgi:hypothetical protein